MANEMVVVEKVTRGRLKSSAKVISKYKGELTKNVDQVCVWYHWKVYLSGTWESDNRHWDTGSGGIGHQRLLEVTNQGHLKRYIDLTEVWSGLCLTTSLPGRSACQDPGILV